MVERAKRLVVAPAEPPLEGSGAEVPAVLAATKLVPPPHPSSSIERPRLMRRLDGLTRYRFTLLAAPPGSGKTTVLAQWLARQGYPVVWVRLDEGDDDPTRFWLYVAAGLDRALPGTAGPLLTLLRTPQTPSGRAVATTLANALLAERVAAAGTVLLVLDDYHVLTKLAIHEAVSALIDLLPPHAHLVLTSRSDPPLPLARLRTRNDLLELRAEDLRFTVEESGRFLAETMGLRLSPEHVQTLEARTEGWAAGLQLAGLSLQGRGDVAAFLDGFAGTHRYIVDYLTAEVLERQAAPVRDFLLRTSLLDQLSAPLCAAVTGEPEISALLTHLERANLFVVPLDDERCWFRYHALFAEALRLRLSETYPDEMCGLHLRASDWFEHAGMFQKAAEHAIAAGAMERAAALVAIAAQALWKHTNIALLRALLDDLPDDVVRARPLLCLYHAWTRLAAGQFSAGRERLEHAEGAIAARAPESLATERETIEGALCAIRATLARIEDRYDQAEALSRRTLDLMAEDETMWRTIATLTLGQIAWARGDHMAARRAFGEAARLGEQAGDDFAVLTGIMGAAETEVDAGHLRLAAGLFRRGVARYRDRGMGLPPAAGYLLVCLADLCYEWNRLEEAEQLVRESLELGRLGEVFDIEYNGLITLSHIHQARGRHADALSTALDVERMTRNAGVPALNRAVAAWIALMRFEQGDLHDAREWAAEALAAYAARNDDPTRSWGPPMLLPRVLLASGRADEALRILCHLEGTAERTGQTTLLVKALALHAVALDGAGRLAQALGTLERALQLAQHEGYVRSFAELGAPMRRLLAALAEAKPRPHVAPDHLAALLDACPAAGPTPRVTAAIAVTEGLSDRECEVIRLMAAGAANQEIAETLVVSIHTVKTHVAHILAKLCATNRTQAVARAREMGLVERLR